jgi:hypothetical protein
MGRRAAEVTGDLLEGGVGSLRVADQGERHP